MKPSLVAILAILPACSTTLESLGTAQDLFSSGANADNRSLEPTRFVGEFTADVFSGVAARAYYGSALTALEATDEEELELAGLLGTKLILEALCLWRLGRHLDAVYAARIAYRRLEAETPLSEPDRVIARVLPELILLDELRDRVSAATGDELSEPDALALLAQVERVADRLERASSTAGDLRGLQSYLVQSQLRAYEYANRLLAPGRPASLRRVKAADYSADVDRLLRRLDSVLPAGSRESATLLDTWRSVF